MKRLTVLGVTGSVGRRTLELVEHFPEDFRVEFIPYDWTLNRQ